MTLDVEYAVVNETFARMLAKASGDGKAKRERGEKPPWWLDQSHEPAIFSHLNKWKHGEVVDPESGAHPLVHLAWRALAIAYQETYGTRPPITGSRFRVDEQEVDDQPDKEARN